MGQLGHDFRADVAADIINENTKNVQSRFRSC